MWGGLLVLTLGLLPGGARGQTEAAREAPLRVDVPTRSVPAPLEPSVDLGGRPAFEVLPATVSVVPGLLLHGLGPLVARDMRTAGRLFLLEGTGLGLLAAGGVPIALSGASRRLIGPLYVVTLTGFGLFSISTLANLYAAVGPAFPPGLAPQHLPPLEFDSGDGTLESTPSACATAPSPAATRRRHCWASWRSGSWT